MNPPRTNQRLPVSNLQRTDADMLDDLRRAIFEYVRHEVNPRNGLIFGLNQGPIILMIENFQSELIWKCIRTCPYIVQGLRHAGFGDGWLDEECL
jgi:hypothetical protein